LGRPAQDYSKNKNMFFVYVLQSLKDRRTYVGYTYEINQRLAKHNSGQVKATRNRRPLKLLFTEVLETEKEAKKRELYWKNGAGRRKLKEYFKDSKMKL